MARTHGFLTRGIARWRLYTDEPSVNAKYSDTVIAEMLQESSAFVLGEVVRSIGMGKTLQSPPRTYMDITLGDNDSDQWYAIHPYVGKVLRVELLDSESNPLGTVFSEGEGSPAGKGYRLEQDALWVQEAHFDSGCILRVHYVPSGCAALHEGTAQAVATDGTTLTMATSVTVGEIDTHPNAYAGSRLRILTATTNSYVQERTIASHAVATKVLTLSEPLNPVPGGATITYEVCPPTNQVMDKVIFLHATMDVLAVESDSKRYGMMKDRLANALRELRLHFAQRDAQSGGKMERSRYMNV